MEQQLSITDEIQKMGPQFKALLPPAISLDRYTQTVLTALMMNPQLGQCDRRSFLQAALKCASDGLLPDRKEAAFVPFSENLAKNGEPAMWINRVVYIQMYQGTLKLIRNSGQLETIASRIVFENDKFQYLLGDDERIVHEPLLKGLRGQPIGVYCIAKLKDGAIYREYMNRDEIEAVKNFSKAKHGPWHGVFETEMWKKTVLRRLAKRLPMSTDLIGSDHEDETDVTPTESPAVKRLRQSLEGYCERQGGGSPSEILTQLIGHDSFAELNDFEADRVHKDLKCAT